MSTSVTFRALAPTRRAAPTAPGARRRAAAPRAPARRGEALARTSSRKRRKQKGGSGGDVDAIVAPERSASEAEAPPETSPSPPPLDVSSESGPSGSTNSTSPSEPLPVATRDDVLDSCYGTTFWLLALGVAAREGAHFGQGTLPSFVSDWTADLPLVAALHPPSSPGLVLTHAGVALGVAATVTAARRALLATSNEFREATNRSNAQVLRPLSSGDVVTVSLLPAVAEETVFRGVLIPAFSSVSSTYGAVVISGLVFGALHVGGGRNAAFAAWASLVGVLYGAAAVATGDVATAMLAHGIANYASASLWLKEDAEGGAPKTENRGRV